MLTGPEEKRCAKCGETKPLDGFTPSRTGLYGRQSHCKACRRAHSQKMRDLDPEQHRRISARSLARRQAKTGKSASRHGFEWTGPELEIASDQSRTSREVALTLGRSYLAVANVRHRLKTDPRKIRLAGLPNQEETK